MKLFSLVSIYLLCICNGYVKIEVKDAKRKNNG